jgi:hypothetical protein
LTFPHNSPEFDVLLRIVADRTGLPVALVEKDYWVTHTLWALQDAGFAIWFKGGTSLSKGFHLIQRFSEDLDLRIDAGSHDSLETPATWDGRSGAQIRQRVAYFESLAAAIGIPDADVEQEAIDEKGRGARYRVRYPGAFVDELALGMRPFVLIEAGVARVAPNVRKRLSSFVHDYLAAQGNSEFRDNCPTDVRCVHPLVTLVEKLDAIARRYGRADEAPAFVRHYEDAARIIQRQADLPPLDTSVLELATEMVAGKEIRCVPSPDDPALALPDAERRADLERAHDAITPMFWGDRISLEESCAIIRSWAENL